jgi:uncharacterized protein
VIAVTEQDRILHETQRFVLTHMAQNDAAHDTGHIRRVVALARTIAAAYPEADLFRVELLAWLHDMNDDKLSSNVGLDRVADHLRRCHAPEEEVRFIIQAIPYISYRKHPHLSEEVPLEIRIVQDADRMDAMGAVGVARTFAYGGAKHRSLADSLQHFDEKLLRLYDLLSTEEAKRIAQPRHAFLQTFYAQYQAEMAAPHEEP